MNKNGFTLAEVLITLAIIGIVAALTIPTLMTDSRYQLVSSRIAKFVSVTEDAALAYSAMNGEIESVDKLKDIILYKSKDDTKNEYQLKDGTSLVVNSIQSDYITMSPYNDTAKYGTAIAELQFFHNVSGIDNVRPFLYLVLTNKGYVTPNERDWCARKLFDNENNDNKAPFKLTKALADGDCKNTSSH